MTRITEAKNLKEFTIVKTLDGQVGILTNVRQNKPLILLDGENRSGLNITRDTKLEVMLYPAQLANFWMSANRPLSK
jgi:hypothetical protein